MPPLNWCNSPLTSFTASADNSHNLFYAHQWCLQKPVSEHVIPSVESDVHCSQKKPWSAANSSFWLCPQAQGILLQSTAYLFVFLSLEHSALSTSWLLHLFLLLVHQLLSWLPHSHSKILLRETFPESCMVGGFFRLLPYHWIPTWHLLQSTTIFIVSSFVIYFPN